VRAGLLGLALAPLLLAGCAPRAARPDRPSERTSERRDREERGEDGLGRRLGEGMASFYGEELAGRPTANGERFNPGGLTAAHRTLRFDTCLDVVNLENGRRVRVRVNDRGPYAKGRILDLSRGAAARLGMLDKGVARVRLHACGRP
jgi:rare lipoprotein A